MLCAAVGIIASHAVLPLGKLSWRSKALLSISAAIIAGGVVLGFGPLHRPFILERANLSNQSLVRDNLSHAILIDANLSHAILVGADLSHATLFGANLSDANLGHANLSDANLSGADLSGADLRGADLSGSKKLSQTQLDKGCGNEETKPPAGLTLKPCD